MRIAYDDSYHLDSSMLQYKALYDDYAGCPIVGKIRQAYHYGSLVIKDITEGSVSFVKS